jgi:hypothetical protein
LQIRQALIRLQPFSVQCFPLCAIQGDHAATFSNSALAFRSTWIRAS